MAGVICGGVGDVTWHVGDREGARSVVDAGNVGVWLLVGMGNVTSLFGV